jgi:hypothetical protein
VHLTNPSTRMNRLLRTFFPHFHFLFFYCNVKPLLLVLLMEMAARKRPPCLAAESAVLSLAPSLFSQTFCLSCLLGAASEMRSGGFVTRTVCSVLEVKSVSPICFNFVKRSKQCYQWISVVGILDSSSSST